MIDDDFVATRRVIVDMPEQLIERLNRMAGDMDRPRAWVIRQLCDEGLLKMEAEAVQMAMALSIVRGEV